ncbi:hypothetical protein [Rhodanobacter sp. DHB23]|uniref:hypothetical protein n=1 Tax=Rhodanobacter sp. DHB23 TaxID=2775923 RepID=UPI00177D2FB0|nr:hypothetical protein [Rhodanobacter sp. DHB23]MBD8872874.1 hypothetical protein [Rhodanobacter sp. DHB23]
MSQISQAQIRHRAIMKSVALMHSLMERTDSDNVGGFSRLYDELTASVALPRGGGQVASSSESKKWYPVAKGLQPITMAALSSLRRVFPDAEQLYDQGPSDLWKALWGSEVELWPICRTTKFDGDLLLGDCETFQEALLEFEADMLLAEAYEIPMDLSRLVVAVALYRLYCYLNHLAPLDLDGAGLYRCVGLCLGNGYIRLRLKQLGVYEDFNSELLKMEQSRLHRRGAEIDLLATVNTNLEGYLKDPVRSLTADQRWAALSGKLDWL